MGSSKFATPFFKKSPLLGAYTSGADAMVTISDAPHYAKLQSDIGAAVSKATTEPVDNCEGLDDRLLSNEIGPNTHKRAKEICAKRNKKPAVKGTKSFESVAGKKPFEGINVGLSNFKESNKTNPFYSGEGYEGGKFDEVEIPSVRPLTTFLTGNSKAKSKKEQDAISNAGKLIFK